MSTDKTQATSIASWPRQSPLHSPNSAPIDFGAFGAAIRVTMTAAQDIKCVFFFVCEKEWEDLELDHATFLHKLANRRINQYVAE